MPSVLLWACSAENLFLFAAQKNLRIFLSCFFTGRDRGGKRHLLLSACGRRAATSDWRNPKKRLRDLHALERRSHSADHGPSFASLFPPLAAVSSAAIPVRVKLKIPRANAAAASTVDIPTGWDPRANQSPTGALVAVLRTAALFDSRMGQIKNALAQCAKAFL